MSVLKIRDKKGNFISVPSISGKGIEKIEKDRSEGLIDIYKITYTDGSTQEFQITNGSSGDETDPTVPDHVKNITQENINEWNNKQNKLTAGSNITITDDGVISATGGGGGSVEVEMWYEEEVESWK